MACGGASESVAVYGDDGYVSVVLMMAMPTAGGKWNNVWPGSKPLAPTRGKGRAPLGSYPVSSALHA
jgi:hypothetical protein